MIHTPRCTHLYLYTSMQDHRVSLVSRKVESDFRRIGIYKAAHMCSAQSIGRISSGKSITSRGCVSKYVVCKAATHVAKATTTTTTTWPGNDSLQKAISSARCCGVWLYRLDVCVCTIWQAHSIGIQSRCQISTLYIYTHIYTISAAAGARARDILIKICGRNNKRK